MTQSEFAEAVGKSLSSVQKYESGDIDIPLSMLYSISEVLGVSVSYLVDCQNSYTKANTVADVMEVLIELCIKEGLKFDINVNNSPNECRTFSITFKECDIQADYNSEFCHFLEVLKNNIQALETYHIDEETFRAWAESTIQNNRFSFLTEKKTEKLYGEELARKRDELIEQKVKNLCKDKQKKTDTNKKS